MNILSINEDYNLVRKIKVDHIIKRIYFQIEDKPGVYNWIKKISPDVNLMLTCIANDKEILSLNFINPKLIKHKYIADDMGNFRLGVVQYGKEELTELPVEEELKKSRYEVATNRCFLISKINSPIMSDFDILTKVLKLNEDAVNLYFTKKETLK